MIERHAVRAVILSPRERVLLAQMHLSDRSFWCMPGGGIQDGESALDALRRELREEVGDLKWKPGAEVWYRSHSFDFEGEAYLQHERFFLVPTEDFLPPSQMSDLEEQQYFGQFRWWTAAEIAVAPDAFEPRQLSRLLHEVIRSVPSEPVYIGERHA